MNRTSATFRDGRVILDAPVNWPDGTKLHVVPTTVPPFNEKTGSSLRNLKPLDLGKTLLPLDAGDDLLEEMLNASGD